MTAHTGQNYSLYARVRENWKDFVYAIRDLKVQRTRTFFGIGGILVSILVMQVVGVVNDSLAYSFLDSSATASGAADFIVTRRMDGFVFSVFMNQSSVESKIGHVEEIEGVFPRLLLVPTVDVVNPGPHDKLNRTVLFYGLDVQEEDAGGLGRFRHVDDGSVFNIPVPDGYCIITPNLAESLNVGPGDRVLIRYASFPAVNLTVLAIVNQEQKFSLVEVELLVTSLEWVQQRFLLDGKVNHVLVSIRNREHVYDTRNIPGTISRMRAIAISIQDTLGSDYQVNMPKLSELESGQILNMAMSVAFIFISFVSMLISGILINSILSTAVEDRIREFGIFRVIGARKSFSFKLVVFQGIFMSIVGSAGGVVLGSIAGHVGLPIFYNWLGMWTNPIELVVLPSTVLISFLTGIGITFIVSARPAMKAARTKIVNAINPYKHKQSSWKVKREGQVDSKLVSSGIAAVIAGSMVFFLIPQIVLTGDVYVLLVAFIGVQGALLLGLTLLSLGFVPGFEWVIWRIFKFFDKKTTSIVRTSLYRYRRRNTSTVLLFTTTFTLILFLGTTMELMKVTQRYQIMVNYGTPMVLYSTGVQNQVDENLMHQIMTMDGVSGVAGAYTDAIDIAGLMLQLSSVGIDDLSIGGLLESSRYAVSIADLVDYYSFTAALIGINHNYTRLMPQDLMKVNGGPPTLEKLFEPGTSNVIIARSIADAGKIRLGDNVRLTFRNGTNIHRLVNATVVGISSGMPGFWQFREAKIASLYGGVLVSRDNYLDWMDLNQTNAPLSKIFIDVENISVDALNSLRSEIDQAYQLLPKAGGGQYNFVVQHAQARIERISQSLSTVQLLFQTLLTFAILIALFGLMSSVYSTVIERKREIGVLKALGLKNHQTRNLFMMESVIILLASSINGSLIGIFSSLINTYQQTLITEIPIAVITNMANIPWSTIFMSFSISLGSCILGMALLLRKIEKMQIIEIFRETM